MADEAGKAEFAMQGARSAMSAGLSHVEDYVRRLEAAVVDDPAFAFDLAKAVMESACRSILSERSVAYQPTDDLPKLFRIVTTTLPFLPPSASAESDLRKSLSKALNGLQTAVLGVCELRNAYGFSAHGIAGPRPVLEPAQALLAAGTADAIVGFLYRVHRQDMEHAASKPPDFEENPAFNQYVDDEHERVRIFDEKFNPSRILFVLAPEAYKMYLSSYSPGDDPDTSDIGADGEPS